MLNLEIITGILVPIVTTVITVSISRLWINHSIIVTERSRYYTSILDFTAEEFAKYTKSVSSAMPSFTLDKNGLNNFAGFISNAYLGFEMLYQKINFGYSGSRMFAGKHVVKTLPEYTHSIAEFRDVLAETVQRITSLVTPGIPSSSASSVMQTMLFDLRAETGPLKLAGDKYISCHYAFINAARKDLNLPPIV